MRRIYESDRMIVECSENWRLVLRRVRLGCARLQYSVQPGEVAVLKVGGRITDKYGQPQVFWRGERPGFNPLASRWQGIPGLGKVEQEVITFPLEIAQLAVLYKQAPFGFSEQDPVCLYAYFDLKLIDPLKMWEKIPDLVDREDAEIRLIERMEAAIRYTDWDFMELWRGLNSYLLKDNPEEIQSILRERLRAALVGWGIEVTDAQKPVYRYPDSLQEVVYGIRLGEVCWQALSQEDRGAFLSKFNIVERSQRDLLEKLANEAGSGKLFSYLWTLTVPHGEAALQLVLMGGDRSIKASEVLGMVKDNLHTNPEALDTLSLILKVLGRQQAS